MMIVLRICEAAVALVGVVIMAEGLTMLWRGRWPKRWKWILRSRPRSSSRLFGLGIIAFGFEFLTAPLLLETKAPIYTVFAIAWILVATALVPALFYFSNIGGIHRSTNRIS